MTREEKINTLIQKNVYDIHDLVTIVELLRAPGGCPWDREQTHQSLRKDLIEECYEVIEAIDAESSPLLREELGDLLLQVVMHARMEEEEGRFTLADVISDIAGKMLHRHPHVFGDVQADTVEKVLSNWELIKSEEKSRNTTADKLKAVPRPLPALMRAAKVGKKAADMDFPGADAVLFKLREEAGEVAGALDAGDKEAVFEELGDLLFSAANLCRHAGVEPEEALTAATDKFIRRYEAVEALATLQGLALTALSDEEKEILWQKAKKTQKNQKND